MANTGRPTGERTIRFIANYMDEHKNGLTCKQIAKKYGISYSTALDQLQKIADANGETRDSLLERPNKTHRAHLFTHQNSEKVNVTAVKEKCNKMFSAIKTAKKTFEELSMEVNE